MSAREDRQAPERPRMTLRVYTVNGRGVVTQERAEVRVMAGEMTDPDVLGLVCPPCRCRRCRTAAWAAAGQAPA
ncbi:hypothetical protein GCM10010211_35240 [Streptomyces albospinus]|uniref:Uncharacterized protein n=1 Tax=Streptomyces albospinus TaxID=285515 RepID=A0ABQ2V456_9ACTN|nr:hypothetical protein GCM10010211_35240 [Streptomyces albospinus]